MVRPAFQVYQLAKAAAEEEKKKDKDKDKDKDKAPPKKEESGENEQNADPNTQQSQAPVDPNSGGQPPVSSAPVPSQQAPIGMGASGAPMVPAPAPMMPTSPVDNIAQGLSTATMGINQVIDGFYGITSGGQQTPSPAQSPTAGGLAGMTDQSAVQASPSVPQTNMTSPVQQGATKAASDRPNAGVPSSNSSKGGASYYQFLNSLRRNGSGSYAQKSPTAPVLPTQASGSGQPV